MDKGEKFATAEAIEAFRERVWASAIEGLRVRGPIRQTVKRPLPGGQFYTGEDATEYKATYLAALVDQGIPADVAKQVVNTLAF